MQQDPTLSGFRQRLLEILDEKPQVWWAENLGVSQSVLSGGWKKGSFPKSDNLAKIIRLSGVSPNWLILGLGPRQVKFYSSEAVELAQDQNREVQVRIIEKEAEIESLKKRLNAMERMVAQQRIGIPLPGMHDLPVDDPTEHDHVLETSLLPMLALARSLNDILCKALESYVKTGASDQKIKRLMAWVYDNFDKHQQDAKASSEALETEFEE